MGSNATTCSTFIPATASGIFSCAATSGKSSDAAASGINATAMTSGEMSNATASGRGSTAMSSGMWAGATSSGDYVRAMTSGDCSPATTSGDYSRAIASGSADATACGDHVISTTLGYSQITRCSVSGSDSVAAALNGGAASGVIGSWLVLAEYGASRSIVEVRAVQVDGGDVKADVFYRLQGGELVEIG